MLNQDQNLIHFFRFELLQRQIDPGLLQVVELAVTKYDPALQAIFAIGRAGINGLFVTGVQDFNPLLQVMLELKLSGKGLVENWHVFNKSNFFQ